MFHCAKCGNQLIEGYAFCPNCYAPVEGAYPVAQQPIYPLQAQPATYPLQPQQTLGYVQSPPQANPLQQPQPIYPTSQPAQPAPQAEADTAPRWLGSIFKKVPVLQKAHKFLKRIDPFMWVAIVLVAVTITAVVPNISFGGGGGRNLISGQKWTAEEKKIIKSNLEEAVSLAEDYEAQEQWDAAMQCYEYAVNYASQLGDTKSVKKYNEAGRKCEQKAREE